MKKFIITSILAVAPFIGFAQTTAFDKFKDVDGITSVTLNKELFEMAGNIEVSGNEKTDKCLSMVKNLDGLKVFTTSEKKHMKNIRNAVSSYLKSNTLSELMSINDKGSKVKIYVKEGAGKADLREALVFVEDDKDKQVVLLSFTGNINLNDLKKLK